MNRPHLFLAHAYTSKQSATWSSRGDLTGAEAKYWMQNIAVIHTSLAKLGATNQEALKVP